MIALLRPALVLLGGFTILLGIVVPLAFTGLAGAVFPHEAGGSLVREEGRVVGSTLIAQRFDGPEWFHPRPSAAGTDGFDAASSGASNLGPSSRPLLDAVRERVAALGGGPVPAESATRQARGSTPTSARRPRARRSRASRRRAAPPRRAWRPWWPSTSRAASSACSVNPGSTCWASTGPWHGCPETRVARLRPVTRRDWRPGASRPRRQDRHP
jgi:K+-transporting ATPase ATPase C chain